MFYNVIQPICLNKKKLSTSNEGVKLIRFALSNIQSADFLLNILLITIVCFLLPMLLLFFLIIRCLGYFMSRHSPSLHLVINSAFSL